MSFINEVIDRVLAKEGLPSDSALATRLGIGRQSVLKWRNGEASPSRAHIMKLASMLEISPVVLSMGIDAEDWHPRFRDEWATAIKALGSVSAALFVAVMLWTPPAAASLNEGASIHYAKYVRCLRNPVRA